MPNQRKPGISRISVTLPDEMLERIEAEAQRRAELEPGFDRLRYIREALIEKLSGPPPKSSTTGGEDSKRKK
jgi:metal-responsive CopG/Arc/MetJ family transcriptional regulator